MRVLLSFLLFVSTSYAVSATTQHATICKFEVAQSKATTGAACYDNTGTICFERSMDDFRKAGDSMEKIYGLTITFKEGAHSLTGTPGYDRQYCDEANVISLYKNQKLSGDDIFNYDFAFNIPVAAFNLAQGKHTITPFITLIDNQSNHSILRKGKQTPVIRSAASDARKAR